MLKIRYERIKGQSKGYYALVSVLLFLTFAGAYSTYLMCEQGIYLTGMTNRIPWGLQIVMAVFYIGLSAGSLVVSGLYGIFGRMEYKPFARIAAYLAMLFLIAGLLSIITDQGRVGRVFIEPFTHFNLRSMFSINPALYSGHILICIVYLWALFKDKGRLTKITSVAVVAWAICTHSGTAAIFALTNRELYSSPLLPPSFVAAALSSGAALMIIVIVTLFKITKRHLDDGLVTWLGRLLFYFIIATLYLILIENTYRLYLVKSKETASFFLFHGINGVLFWGGLILIGSIIPLVLLFKHNTGKSVPWIVFASSLVVFGILCERYLIVIPGESHPAILFPGMEVVGEMLEEGVATYSISFLEIIQAMGVFGFIGFFFVYGLKKLSLLPLEARLKDTIS